MFLFDLLPGVPGRGTGPYLDGHKYYCHVREPRLASVMRQCVTIAPLRERHEVEASWLRRGMRGLESQWEELQRLPIDFRLQIDGADRDSRLGELSKMLGVQLRTDWKPSNSVRPT
jgi:hypothetical protein